MADILDKTAGEVRIGPDILPIQPTQSPIITFELVPTFGHIVGLIDICLVATRAGVGAEGASTRRAEVVANLRCTKAGAIDLRNALNSALLMLEPVENPDGPAN